MAKRLKTRFTSREIAHAWASQKYPHGKSSSNMSFDGARFYSYATVIAEIVKTPKGETVYFLSEENYSVSTSQHQHCVRSAAGYSNPLLIEVPGQGRGASWRDLGDPDRILTAWQREAKSKIADSATARQQGRKADLLLEAHAIVGKMRRVARLFGCKLSDYPVKLPITSKQAEELAGQRDEQRQTGWREREDRHMISAAIAPHVGRWTRRLNPDAPRTNSSALHALYQRVKKERGKVDPEAMIQSILADARLWARLISPRPEIPANVVTVEDYLRWQKAVTRLTGGIPAAPTAGPGRSANFVDSTAGSLALLSAPIPLAAA